MGLLGRKEGAKAQFTGALVAIEIDTAGLVVARPAANRHKGDSHGLDVRGRKGVRERDIYKDMEGERGLKIDSPSAVRVSGGI